MKNELYSLLVKWEELEPEICASVQDEGEIAVFFLNVGDFLGRVFLERYDADASGKRSAHSVLYTAITERLRERACRYHVDKYDSQWKSTIYMDTEEGKTYNGRGDSENDLSVALLKAYLALLEEQNHD